MTSLVYTLDGRLKMYKGRQQHSIPFVRKMINLANSGGVVELAIAKLLMKNIQELLTLLLRVEDQLTLRMTRKKRAQIKILLCK